MVKRCVHVTGGIDLFPTGAAIDSETYREIDARLRCSRSTGWSPADVMERWPACAHFRPDTEVLYQANTGIVSPAATVPLLQRLASQNNCAASRQRNGDESRAGPDDQSRNAAR